MRLKHWLGLAGAVYFVVTGINEAVSTDNATIDSLPDFGYLTGSQAGVADYTAAGLDFAAAGLIYVFVLHKSLF